MSTDLRLVRTLHGVSEYALTNGLRVLYREEKSVPLVAVCVTFHVGSRNEKKGHTGSTHILEHLLFKDTEKFNKQNGKSITAYLEYFGAIMNATTWLDRTNYFEVLPKEHVEEAIALEADRMRNALFSVEDLATEMTVVRNEYERSRNDPFELLEEKMLETAFKVHPYRIPTIGYKEDIEGATVEKLREFYNQFYWPNNATLTVVGDISRRTLESLVQKYFAPIPRSPRAIPTLRITEPKQTKPYRCVLKKPLGISIAALAYKIPEATSKDYPAVELLVRMLAGGFSSHLNQVLVDTGLAVSITPAALLLHDPGVVFLIAQAADGVDPKELLQRMRKELQIYFARFTLEDLAYAKERFLKDYASGFDGLLNEVRLISECIAAGEWQLAYLQKEAIMHITLANIGHVAKKYFTRTQETSGLLLNTH